MRTILLTLMVAVFPSFSMAQNTKCVGAGVARNADFYVSSDGFLGLFSKTWIMPHGKDKDKRDNTLYEYNVGFLNDVLSGAKKTGRTVDNGENLVVDYGINRECKITVKYSRSVTEKEFSGNHQALYFFR